MHPMNLQDVYIGNPVAKVHRKSSTGSIYIYIYSKFSGKGSSQKLGSSYARAGHLTSQGHRGIRRVVLAALDVNDLGQGRPNQSAQAHASQAAEYAAFQDIVDVPVFYLSMHSNVYCRL